MLTAELCSFTSCSEGSWYNTWCRRSACAITKKRQEIKGSTHAPQLKSGQKLKQISNSSQREVWFGLYLSPLFSSERLKIPPGLAESLMQRDLWERSQAGTPFGRNRLAVDITQAASWPRRSSVWSLQHQLRPKCLLRARVLAAGHTASALPPAPFLKCQQSQQVYFEEVSLQTYRTAKYKRSEALRWSDNVYFIPDVKNKQANNFGSTKDINSYHDMSFRAWEPKL